MYSSTVRGIIPKCSRLAVRGLLYMKYAKLSCGA